MLHFLQTDDGEDDLKKGTQLLEIYALEIQMYTAQKNNKKLKVSTLLSLYNAMLGQHNLSSCCSRIVLYNAAQACEVPARQPIHHDHVYICGPIWPYILTSLMSSLCLQSKSVKYIQFRNKNLLPVQIQDFTFSNQSSDSLICDATILKNHMMQT